MQKATLINNLTADELRDMMRECVREELQAHTPPPPEYDPNELLTIKQVVDLLQISEVTLHNWKRKGKIPFERMQGRVYFKRGAVMDAMKSVQIKKA